MNWTRGPGTRGGSGRNLPAGLFDPTLLSCAKKRRVEPPGRNCFLRWRVNTQGSADPCAIPGVLVSNCYHVGLFYGFCQHSRSGLQLQSGLQDVQRSDCRAANLQSFAAARHFCSAKILAGGLRWGWGPRCSREAVPAQRNFQRKFTLCRVGSSKFVVPPTIEYSKVRRHARFVTCPNRAAPGCQRDHGPSVWERVQRKPFSRVFFGQLLPGGSTRRFFAQLRSVGSK